MKCPRCQKENPWGHKFCGDCGTPLKAPTTDGAPALSYADVTSSLKEALEQQAATTEILRVISSSPTHIQPIFDAIASSAVRLCEARIVTVFRFDGELIHLIAHHGYTPEALELRRGLFPAPRSEERRVGKECRSR